MYSQLRPRSKVQQVLSVYRHCRHSTPRSQKNRYAPLVFLSLPPCLSPGLSLSLSCFYLRVSVSFSRVIFVHTPILSLYLLPLCLSSVPLLELVSLKRVFIPILWRPPPLGVLRIFSARRCCIHGSLPTLCHKSCLKMPFRLAIGLSFSFSLSFF